MSNNVNLRNQLLIVSRKKKGSSPIFKSVNMGETIDVNYPLGDMTWLAGVTPLISIGKNGVTLGQNKLSQLRKNLLPFVIVPSRTERGKEDLEVEEKMYDSIDIQLYGRFRVVEIKKKTTAKFFNKLELGDVFVLRLDLNSSGVPNLRVIYDNKEAHRETPSRIKKFLENFELEELERVEL